MDFLSVWRSSFSFLLMIVSFLFLLSCGDDEGDNSITPPPPDASFNFDIDESFDGGDLIGDLSVTDPSGLSLTYDLIESASTTLFQVRETTGELRLDTLAILDFDEETEFLFEVKVSNGASETDGTITVRVTYKILDAPFSYGKYDYIQPSSSAMVGDGWEEFNFSSEDCKCLNGGAFKAAVKDNSSGSNLVITLQGGGACWTGVPGNCEGSATTVSSNYISIANFSLALADSLGETWDHVMIPYCDKSVYTGDNSVDYDNDGDVQHFWGFRNSSAGVNLAVENFPNANRILLTGCSAGGYGTIFMVGLVRYHYPNAEIYVINESGAGLFNPDDPVAWTNIRSNWGIVPAIPEGCAGCDQQFTDWYGHFMSTDEKLKVAQYHAYQDGVIRFFLGMVDTPVAFESHLLLSTNALNSQYPDRYKRFFITGDSHCQSEAGRNYAIGGQTYWNWVQAFMNDDPAWVERLE